jgi:pyruvate dehydrogenase E2 component (dihydrolipoamide acetyltransferase)
MASLIDVPMPRLSDSMQEGVVLTWLKSVGEEVALGDDLVEIETDKANMVFEADAAGTVIEILVPEGEAAAVGSVIARLGEPGATPLDNESRAADSTDANDPADDANSGNAASPIENGGRSDGRVKASPVARRLAKQHALELAEITGSGPGGRIVKADVEAALASGSAPTSVPSLPSASSPAQAGSSPPPGSRSASTSLAPAETTPGEAPTPGTARGEVQVVELTKLQQTIARRMAESKATAPHFYLSAELDMSRCVEARTQVKDGSAEGDVVPSFNDIIVKATALALREFPRANGSYRDGRWELYSRVNVGIAVAAQDALVVPTIFDADRKGLRQIAAESRALAERVGDQSITPPELSGGTFTVSNLGMHGISSFQAVINPPQAGILAVGEIAEKPVVSDGQIATAQLMGVTLACDHRILYGTDGAEFLARIRSLLEEPVALAL